MPTFEPQESGLCPATCGRLRARAFPCRALRANVCVKFCGAHNFRTLSVALTRPSLRVVYTIHTMVHSVGSAHRGIIIIIIRPTILPRVVFR